MRGPSQYPKVRPGNTITVGVEGCDYTTVQDAINAASAGDQIKVHNGTYAEQLVMKAGVSVIGEDPRNCIIDCSGFTEGINIAAASNCELSGITIKIEPVRVSANGADNLHLTHIIADNIDNFICRNNIFEGGNWAIKWINSAANHSYYANQFFCPNPFVSDNNTNQYMSIVDNYWHFVGDMIYCHAFFDGAGDDSIIANNYGQTHNTADAVENDAYYAMGVSGKRLLIAGNNFDMLDDVRTNHTACKVSANEAAVTEADKHIVSNNTFIMRGQGDRLTRCIILTSETQVYIPFIDFVGNNFDLTSSNGAAVKWNVNISDAVVPTADGGIRADSQSFRRDWLTDARYLTFTKIGEAEQTTEYLLNVKAGNNAANHIYTDLDISGIFNGTEAFWPQPDHSPDVPRTLSYVFTDGGAGCAGKVYVRGINAHNERVEEEITYAAAGTIAGNVAFATVESIHSRDGDLGIVNVWVTDKLGLKKSVSAEADVSGIGKNWAAPVVASAVDTDYHTVTPAGGAIADDDDFLIIYDGV
jgi:hypothetical protein